MVAPPMVLGDHTTEPSVDIVIFDFGAVLVSHRVPLQGPLSDLLRLSNELYDSERLLSDSRRGVEELLATIAPAVTKPQVADLVEDCAVYHLKS